MSDEREKKPDPVDDLKKGLGLLIRAARAAVEQLPTGKLEDVVVSGVKEVGRAIENVTDQIDRQVFGGKGTIPHPEDHAQKPPAPPAPPTPPAEAAKAAEASAAEASAAEPKKDETPGAELDPNEEPPRGPRVE